MNLGNKNDYYYNVETFGKRVETDGKMMQEQEIGKGSKLEGIALATILIGIFVFAVAGLAGSGWLTSLSMGIVFVSCSILMLQGQLKKPKKRLGLSLLIGLLGFIFCFIGIMDRFGPRALKSWADENERWITCGVLIVVGAGLILSGFLGRIQKRRYCTELVEGTCIELRQGRGSNSRNLYSPVYRYYYQGEWRTVTNNLFTNYGNPNIEDVRQIYIDPVYFDEYYDPIRARRGVIFKCILGAFFIGMAAYTMYLLQREI